jgi:hypothetical protein
VLRWCSCGAVVLTMAAARRAERRLVDGGEQVKEVMEFRRALPADAKFVIAKNTMMQLAVKDTEFAGFSDGLKVRFDEHGKPAAGGAP